MVGIDRALPEARREPLWREGFALMRERLSVYLGFAGVCAVTGWMVWPHIDLYDVLANHPGALVSSPPVSVVLILAVAATFFILPSALRRLEPTFRMTAWRVVVTLCTVAAVAVVTELGYAFAVLPGIVAGVLLSQVLVGALLREREGSGPRSIVRAMLGAARSSILLTRGHFVTTLGVIVASLAILLVPFTIVLFGLAVLGVRLPASLALMAPFLLLIFVYFECVRYALVMRWYRRLRSEDRSLARA